MPLAGGGLDQLAISCVYSPLAQSHRSNVSQRIAPVHMHIDDLFHAPVNRVEAFAEMQVHLYRHDVRLQDYFLALQSDVLTTPRLSSCDLRSSNSLLASAIQSVDGIGRLRRRQKIKTDILF